MLPYPARVNTEDEVPRSSILAVLALLLAFPPALPARDKQDIGALLAERTARDAQVARQIWEWAEVGYKEKQSSALLQAELKAAGFTVTTGVAGMPTAFVATAGSGKPVIGMLAEFDALPGLSQDAVPQRAPLADGAPVMAAVITSSARRRHRRRSRFAGGSPPTG